MLIVSDTSPITNLIQVGCLDLLEKLFGNIVIPQSVYNELCELEYQQRIIDSQSWITVLSAKNTLLLEQLELNLDKGEAESIVLALEIESDFLIIDELKGRSIAEDMGIKIVGLLGVLVKSKQLGYVSSVKPILTQLTAIGFRVNPALHRHILALVEE